MRLEIPLVSIVSVPDGMSVFSYGTVKMLLRYSHPSSIAGGIHWGQLVNVMQSPHVVQYSVAAAVDPTHDRA